MRKLAPLFAALLLAGCYHVTVVTSAAPPGTHVNREWQNSFVYGLVPPPELDTKALCAQNIAAVETERSFLNGLVGALTLSIYTPMHTKVTCAVGPVAK